VIKPQLRPGTVVTLWHGDGLDDACSPSALALLTEARPEVVQLHAAPRGHGRHTSRVAARVRAAIPGVGLWLGVGCDGWLWEWARGQCSRAVAMGRLTDCADLAVSIGAECVVWNGEAAYKEHATRGADLARGVLESVAGHHPQLAQAFTSYDHPHYHPQPWRSWCYPGSPVTLVAPQVYAAPGGDEAMAHRGALPARERTALASWATAVRKGWVEGDAPAGTPEDASDMDWTPYIQAHSVRASDSIAFALRYPLTSWWALPSRADAEGRAALLAVCKLRRLGFDGPDAVRRYQAGAGLVADGIAGPKTLDALLGPQRKGVAP